MTRRTRRLGVCVLATVALTACGAAAAQAATVITMSGSTSVAPLAALLAKQYVKTHKNVKFKLAQGGSDVGVAEGNYDYAVVADFDNVADWRLFREHPAHLLFMEEHITGKLKGRAAIQYQTPVNRDPFEFSHARMQEFLAEVDELG